MHILLVEDNPGDVVLFREALRYISLPVALSVATNGVDALHLLRRQPPTAQGAPIDLVLLDLNLPLKNGFEVLAELRRDPALQFLPVVVFSSTAHPSEINRCYELGANAYMIKPLSLDAYLQKITAAITFWSACQFRTLPEKLSSPE